MSCSHINIGDICIARISKFIHNISNQMHKSRAFQLKVLAVFKGCIANININIKLFFNQHSRWYIVAFYKSSECLLKFFILLFFLNEMHTCTTCSEEGLMKMAKNVQRFNKMFSIIKIFAIAAICLVFLIANSRASRGWLFSYFTISDKQLMSSRQI